MKKSLLFAAFAAVGLGLMTGCKTELSPEPFDANLRLTAGQVKMTVTEGKTTRAEIFRALGAPNVMALESGKGEIWTYDQIKVRKTKAGYGAGAFFNTLFGFPEVHRSTKDIGNGAGQAGVETTANISTNTTSILTATLVVRFKTDDTVDSYKMLITSF